MANGQPKRPRRQKKSDRLINPKTSEAEQRIDYLLAPFDRLSRHMDEKWGVDTLPEISSPDIAAKFGSAMAKLNAAIDAQDPEEVELRVGVCMRGLEALDRAAVEAGKQPASDDVVIVDDGDNQFGILLDGRAWQRAQDKHPNLELVTRREMAVAYAAWKTGKLGAAVSEVKEQMPGAEVLQFRAREPQPEDDIPF